MSSRTFELRLSQLGYCVKELSNRVQYLQNLFDICLEDYKEDKQKDLRNNSEEYNTLPLSHSMNHQLFSTQRNSKNILNLNNILRKGKEEETKREQNIKINKTKDLDEDIIGYQIKEEVIGDLGGIKRSSPEDENVLIDIKPPFEDEQINEGIYKNVLSTYNTISDPQFPLDNLFPSPGISKENKYISEKGIRVFSRISKEEKELIVEDMCKMGVRQCERKWGIAHSVLVAYNRVDHLFEDKAERKLWITQQKANLGNLISVKQRILNIISESDNIISLEQLSEMSFDKGLGIVAIRYNINIFQLEFLLQQLFPIGWKAMEHRKWFSKDSSHNRKFMSKMDIVSLANDEGLMYASKKSGVLKSIITKYRKDLHSQGFLKHIRV